MSKFIKISVEAIALDRELAEYLGSAEIKAAKRSGAFIGTRRVALNEFRKYGIVLPKGGMIIPDAEPTKLKAAIKEAAETVRRSEVQAAQEEFKKRNDVSFLRRLFATKLWKEGQVSLFSPMSEREVKKTQNILAEYGETDPNHFNFVIGMRMLPGWDVSRLVKREAGDYLLGDAGLVADKEVGYLLLNKAFRFYPLTEESLWQMKDDYKEASRRERVMNFGSYRRMLKADPRNAAVKKLYYTGPTTALEMFGVSYGFTNQSIADKVWQRLRERFFVFASDSEAELAALIASGEPIVMREYEESWTEGPKMRPEGERYIGGNQTVVRTLIGRFKIDDRWDLDDEGWSEEYDRLRKMYEAGIDISPRMTSNPVASGGGG